MTDPEVDVTQRPAPGGWIETIVTIRGPTSAEDISFSGFGKNALDSIRVTLETLALLYVDLVKTHGRPPPRSDA